MIILTENFSVTFPDESLCETNGCSCVKLQNLYQWNIFDWYRRHVNTYKQTINSINGCHDAICNYFCIQLFIFNLLLFFEYKRTWFLLLVWQNRADFRLFSNFNVFLLMLFVSQNNLINQVHVIHFLWHCIIQINSNYDRLKCSSVLVFLQEQWNNKIDDLRIILFIWWFYDIKKNVFYLLIYQTSLD